MITVLYIKYDMVQIEAKLKIIVYSGKKALQR